MERRDRIPENLKFTIISLTDQEIQNNIAAMFRLRKRLAIHFAVLARAHVRAHVGDMPICQVRFYGEELRRWNANIDALRRKREADQKEYERIRREIAKKFYKGDIDLVANAMQEYGIIGDRAYKEFAKYAPISVEKKVLAKTDR